MLQEQTRLMTIEEFIALYDTEGPFELVNGERIPLMPNVAGSTWMIRMLFRLLDAFCTSRALGEVFSELTYILVEKPNWVKGSRVPDLVFYSAERWAKYVQGTPDWKDKPLMMVPDLAVEVVSPNDRYSSLQDKVEEFMHVGIRLIWVVDPIRQRATVYHGNQITTLDPDGILSGMDIVPGFEVKLAELFSA